jgi:hypothetical protein
VSAVERLLYLNDTFEQCAVIGRHQLRDVALIDNKDPNVGIRVTYTGGRVCSSREEAYINARKQISLSLYCSQTQEPSFQLTPNLNELSVLECHTYVEMKTPAGCPTGYIANGRKTALVFV